MNLIESTNYPIYFDNELYKTLNNYLINEQFSSIFILVDENTNHHCLPKLKTALDPSISYDVITVKAGEKFKNIATCEVVWKKLTELNADRKGLLINLGGGMVTDLGGFVASTYKRGIKFINIPTTLLSMVDASVGSKTGVDLDNLKNLIGLFSDPELVLIDVKYLETLSEREIRSGLAEIIKYGLTFDSELLNELYADAWKNQKNLKKIIYRSVAIKNNVVLKDIKEAGLRKVLNFGHTVGHAIESYFLNHTDLPNLLHGEAIAIGMVVESYLSAEIYDFPKDKLYMLKEYIRKTFGSINIPSNSYADIIDLMKHDKKNTNGIINYIFLEDIAKFIIDGKAKTELVYAGLDYYNS